MVPREERQMDIQNKMIWSAAARRFKNWQPVTGLPGSFAFPNQE
jgi:hypothetical protein